MTTRTLKVAAPWCVVLAAVAMVPLAYRYGLERGKLDAMYDEMSSRMPGDLRLMIALLRRDDHLLSPDELVIFRGRLKGTLGFARSMVIPMERDRGHTERVAELQELLDEGDELDKKLGPMHPVAASAEGSTS